MEEHKTWIELKEQGSQHYKSGSVEPIDLYRSLGMFRPWAIAEICNHAIRNRSEEEPVNVLDMQKIIHYAELLIAEYRP